MRLKISELKIILKTLKNYSYFYYFDRLMKKLNLNPDVFMLKEYCEENITDRIKRVKFYFCFLNHFSVSDEKSLKEVFDVFHLKNEDGKIIDVDVAYVFLELINRHTFRRDLSYIMDKYGDLILKKKPNGKYFQANDLSTYFLDKKADGSYYTVDELKEIFYSDKPPQKLHKTLQP